ncbi:RNA polymerase sigma24 factor [Catellatospora sp. TT07R-123]|uniref:SigE family RNA polymerase sigma factor n=1 Tax=Catellatospora sp. TT07R-123 TaxID=2733863 RepID=UPI001AFD0166|nr:SigE family RNA polymerase sigma factor [Catellatospora sp. TT07R-123]GHJ46202.1 RNA polymerase sigma24 factor [Catellatospora sp. TT07R-123]
MTGHRDFAEFYGAVFHRLATSLYVHTRDLAEAQDVVQEAMIRALSRWPSIQDEQPEAWVRRTAWNLATSRWRRMRRGLELVTRGRVEDTTAGPEPDRVAIVAALALLPERQRQAVILHHLEDLPVAEVAEVIGVAEGTVKSWLHRARTTLAGHLADEHAEEVDRV